MWVGLGIFISALIFEMQYKVSNLLLVLSSVILTLGVILLHSESPVLSYAVYFPTYILLLPALLLMGIMKHFEQMGIFLGALVTGFFFATGIGFQIVFAPIIGTIAGLVVTAIGVILVETADWNPKVCLGFLIVVSFIAAPAISFVIYSSIPIDISYTLGIPLIAMLCVIMCVLSFLQDEPQPKRRGY